MGIDFLSYIDIIGMVVHTINLLAFLLVKSGLDLLIDPSW